MITESENIRDVIVNTAVAIAARTSWEAVRIHDIAAELNISLDEIRGYFREKEDLVDAWFDRADGIMLREADTADFSALTSQQRIHRLIMIWLDALAVQRKVTQQMILAKMEPGHIHIQVPAVMRISRTVQWIREAAQRDAIFVRRALEESVLTTIYLMTFFFWMRDETPGSSRTRQFLNRNLSLAMWLDQTIYGNNESKISQVSVDRISVSPSKSTH
ncbi:TetR/AcrR family transcriptional regulator [Nitrosomonas sp. Is37]|uniref:TetR/AcrR family transcriptional regulator n=1 Tax=Nitrosomonas sp. Is37 TaxID=3080535 RepID=UPI00294AB514|nr:TetR/AcrR family transcriptional regulator [Nitrosomonas sp. Is37]MDV6344204.1 TetR/AcrR family transcriptional regulator [Nitrosomonas sp. Is37]